jgi:drug/metabolite transporter (DMT)-like permease
VPEHRVLIGLLAALGAAALFGMAAAAQAIGVREGRMLSPLMGVVALVYLLGWALHLVAIASLPLYLAQVGIAGSLAVTSLIAARVVHEPLERRDWTAIGAMIVGLGLLVATAGDVGRRHVHTGFTVSLYVALLLVLVLGVGAVRARGATGGAAVSVLAGVSFSGSPIATRSLVDPHLDARTVASALAILCFGVLGFWLYSVALRRTSVTAATAPLVLFETLVPAAVGVVVFGDTVRPGWWLVAALGFVVATAGALELSGAESRLEDVHVEQLPEPLHHVAEVLDPGL